MFRRPRRPMRPIPGRIPGHASAHQQMLRKAFQTQASDDPAALAKTFSDLAAQATRNGHPRQAANLQARSAHHWLEANNMENAQIQADQAIAAFAALGMEKRLHEFQTHFETHKLQPGTPFSSVLDQNHSPKTKSLPPNCPQCGAPLRSDEVDWIDNQSAECGFCGSVIKTAASE
jgi:hypothetical protein